MQQIYYTTSQKLKNYFKASMWYGIMNFSLKDNIQTIGATLIASNFSSSKKLKDAWAKIYSVTSFFSGFDEDLGPYEYIEATNALLKEDPFFAPYDLIKEECISKLRLELTKLRSCKIYERIGKLGTIPQFASERKKQYLESANGMRLMGQRFTPDSYVLNTLTGDNYIYRGNRKETMPFTMVHTRTGIPIRGFPRGLDVMATMLDSKNAKEILSGLTDSNYEGYEESSSKLKQKFDSLKVNNWAANLYWSWFYLLKPLLKEYSVGYPTFMKNKSWQDKELTTSLASWSQLRHDTILYAKQSSTIGVTNIIGSTPLSRSTLGYVEPVPEFYNRMLSLTKMISNGLLQMNVLDEESKYRLTNLESLLISIISICQKQLEKKEISKDEYEFINNFDCLLNAITDKLGDISRKTTIICDVHTDQNSEKVLEEGTGFVKLIIVAFSLPDGRILLGAGPILSYYEFKHPMNDRLTDEKWQELLSGCDSPKEPEWVYSFAES